MSVFEQKETERHTTNKHILISVHRNGMYDTLHPIERDIVLRDQYLLSDDISLSYRETPLGHWGQIRDLDWFLSCPGRYRSAMGNNDFFICLLSVQSYVEGSSHIIDLSGRSHGKSEFPSLRRGHTGHIGRCCEDMW